MSQHSVIEHRANYFFLKLEEDYIAIFPEEDGHRHCKAAILSILEHWMNAKRTEISCDDDLYTYLSYPQFVKRMFHLYGRNTVIRSLEELVKSALVLKRPYTDQFNQDTFEYRLHIQAVQTRLQALPDVPVRGSLRINGGSLPINYPSFTDKPGGSLDVNGGSFTDKPNIDTTIDTDIDTSQIPVERAHPSLQRGAINETGDVLEKTLEEVKTASGKHKAVSSHSHAAIGSDEDISLAETAHRIPAVQVPGARSLPLAVTPLSGGQGDTSVQAQILTSEPVPSQDGAASAATPLGGTISATGSGPRRRGKNPIPERPPQLTLEGVQAREWYEEIRDVKVRQTPGNVKDLNDLGECEGLSKLSLLTMIEHLENKKWVKDNQVAISLHMLSGNDARFAFLSFEENWPLIKRKLNGKKPQSRPTLDEVDCIDERWCVYKRPGDDQEWILWQGELCTPEEADERGYAGGGGLYIQTQYAK